MGICGVAIHCNPRIQWQPKRAGYFAEGFQRAGIPWRITDSRVRDGEELPVLLGTTFWRAVEKDGGEFLLVDRCSFGDTEKFVSLVWDGHGRRGDHRVPERITADRWEKHGVPVRPWRSGSRIVLCGQTEPYSPHWSRIDEWYEAVKSHASHFRRHPAGSAIGGMPEADSFDDCQYAITLNSSVAVRSVMEGVPTVTMDEGSMAWDVTGHGLDDMRTPDREPWLHWLAHTQWSDEEIKEGSLWASRL